jgi:NAD(P)-dependent dehydrogenase (short-subunit alcohol dehydrogenase family)
MSTSLDGKVAIVTGSAGGLGKVISHHLLLAGAHVVLSDVSAAALEATYNELKPHGKCISIQSDVSSSSSVQELFEKTISQLGKIDILVNNAGIMDKFDGAADCEEDLWHRVLAINLTGPYLTTKLAVKHFLTRNSPGTILNIISLGGVLGHRAGAAYTASKHGLVGLTKNTAAAYAANKIRCNGICPGAMKTNIGIAMANGVNQSGRAIMEKTLANNPGLCDLDQMAKLAVFLCGPDSEVLNGAVINADLGWSAV